MNSSPLRIAVLCSFNIDLLKRPLSDALAKSGIQAEFYFSGYGLWEIEALDRQSALYQFAPNVVLLFADSSDLLPPLSPTNMLLRRADAVAAGGNAWQRVQAALNGLLAAVPATAAIFVHNLALSTYNTLGTLEGSGGYSAGAAIDTWNERLCSMAELQPRIRVIDYSGFVAEHGQAALRDNRLWHLARMRLGRAGLELLAGFYARYIAAMFTPRRKCLVLDLDNTLWGGVLGEDGVEGIALGQEGIGLAFREFQLAIKALAQRGIVLAIASKNNPADAYEVIDHHPEMVLRRKDFACAEIHWNPKSESLPHIVQQLNLGMDSLVFWDDEPREREIVRTQHPMVLVPEVPTDPSMYARTLLNLDCFDVLNLTEEDRRRGEMYREEAERQRLLEAAPPSNLSEFYQSLQMKVTRATPDNFAVPRFSQLTQRTNQFNFTTRRYSESEIQSMLADPNCGLWTVSLEDRFGKLGVIGAAIVCKQSSVWQLDTFLMSCRALGRGVEDAFLAMLVADAHAAKANLRGSFIPTKKNAPAREFLERLNVDLQAGENSSSEFEMGASQVPMPDWITVERSIAEEPKAKA